MATDIRFGYALSSEEHRPDALVANARRAEEVGFDFAMISDHFHPWTDSQGQSPFVWSVIGGVAQATERIRLGTGVTCPTIRIHPAIIAQASATAAAMSRSASAIVGVLLTSFMYARPGVHATSKNVPTANTVCRMDGSFRVELADTCCK